MRKYAHLLIMKGTKPQAANDLALISGLNFHICNIKLTSRVFYSRSCMNGSYDDIPNHKADYIKTKHYKIRNVRNPKLNLFSRKATEQGHITNPALSHHHPLRPTKTPERSVGRQIGLAHIASAMNVRDVITVVHMEERPLHNLKESKNAPV